MTTGLAAGKFDPPHRGHALLIDTARARCDRLIVLVVDYARQTVPAALRAHWLREIHPGADVRVIPDDPAISAEQTDEEAQWIRAFLGNEAIDVFFSSEHYGEALARALGASHYMVDRERAMVPVTGTMVRRDPVAMLDWLEPCVRAYYVPRVGVVGSESTGKSWLCERLAAHYGTVWVAEYGREYTLEKARSGKLGRWVDDEFVHIAFEQQRREDEAARRANRVLLCDTDALASKIWFERYMEREPTRWPLDPTRIALYLLTYPDVPFVADEIRDGEHKRYWMYERFIEMLTQLGHRFTVLRGTYDERDRQAVEAIDALLEHEVKP
ncbi:MAG TPA: AAA family ATPase [Candidatus Baltobacteraceae bacterium]|nr:AAA family ATPase [Candidatus Baltobacteraceae bacterium]